MHFLITNDDGFGSPGILALERALLPLGQVTVVAPDRHLSGCSHQVTTDRPLTIRRHEERHYAIGGMPADCARLGILHLAPDCDWLISGINEGANAGCDIYYSGTVAAAREGVLFGKPAMAISHYHTRPKSIDWEQAECSTRAVVEQLLTETLPRHSLWNVNFPTPERLNSNTPIRHCSIDPHRLAVAYDLSDDEANYRHGRYHDRTRSPGTDVDICFGGETAVSAVPLYGQI